MKAVLEQSEKDSNREPTESMMKLLNKQKHAFQNEAGANAKTRIDRLDRVIQLLKENQGRLIESASEDFGNRSHHQTQMTDIMATMNGLKHSRDHVERWMKHQKRKVSFPLNLFGAKAHIEHQPKGVVGNISTWNFPIHVSFAPLAGIFSAGNRCMMKLSELTPATSELTQELIAHYFDETELSAVTGGPEIGAQFSSLPFDHLLFTGSTGTGKIILKAAANTLTPVTLELGGKSPVIISRSSDIDEAARKIINGKAINMGQVCLSPDYCFVPSERKSELVAAMRERFNTLFPTIFDNPDYTSVINGKHYQRLQSYLQDAREKGAEVINLSDSGESSCESSNQHKLPLHLVIDPSDELIVMQEEIFGPIIGIKSYDAIEDVIGYINAKPRPLALYFFGDDKREERYVLDHTTSGGVAINDVMTHVSCEELPFGGIGDSGMGYYHGHEGFKTFSHSKSVYRQSKVNFMELAAMVPPYGDKCQKQLNKLTQYR